MNLITWFLETLGDLIDPPIRAIYVDGEPASRELRDKMFAVEGTPQLQKYAYIRCPCGCGDIIVLTSNPDVRPRWTFEIDDARRPTVTPSIWRTSGCRSHFLVQGGRIVWASDLPSARPMRGRRWREKQI